MTDTRRESLVVDVGPLREMFYTGIPNVIAELCVRLFAEDWLDLYFNLDGRWIDNDSMRRCLAERSGASLAGHRGRFRSAHAIRVELQSAGAMQSAVALYTDHRPATKLYSWEGKVVYDLSMILAPECHPAESVRMYTSDLGEQIACSDILFCISESTAHDLAWIYKVGRERIKVALLGNSVDLTWSERVRALVDSRPIEPFLLILGSIEPRKNTALVLRWLTTHPEVLGLVRIVFAGRQAWGDSFASMIEDNRLEASVASGRIVYTGFVDDRVKTALLTGAAAMLYPSVFEGFGLPLLEAMATGTPVLSSVSTSMPEVVGEFGYYFDPCSVASLHAAFLRFWSDRNSGDLARVVAGARQRAGKFNYDTTYDIIIAGLFPRG